MKKILLLLLTPLIISFFFLHNSYAQETSDNNSTVSELQNKINDLQSKISDLQGQKKTLSSQIEVMDNQIFLTQLKIDSTNAQISELSLDIDTADNKIDRLENSLDKLSEILINRIKQTYIVGSSSNFQILISSNNVNDFIQRANYLRIAQANDKRLIYDTVQARNDYATQKEIYQDKKTKTELLSAELEGYQDQLDLEKVEKNTLLAVTKNDEKVYQLELQRALAEQQAILGISSGAGSEVSQGVINKGDVIGSMIAGSSFCSSGTHVHFEVTKGGIRENPSNYLSSKSVIWNNSPDGQFGFGGSWDWPINDSIYINQGFGKTAWSDVYYGGGIHTGIDMSSSSSSNIVKAVNGGELFSGSIPCGGGQLFYKKVDHGDGVQAFYLHIN